MLIGRCQPFPLGRLLSIRYRGLPYGTGAIHYHIRAVQSANGSKESRFRYRREYVRHSLSPCRTFPYRTFSISSPLYENRLDIYIYIHRKRRQLVHSSIFFLNPLIRTTTKTISFIQEGDPDHSLVSFYA